MRKVGLWFFYIWVGIHRSSIWTHEYKSGEWHNRIVCELQIWRFLLWILLMHSCCLLNQPCFEGLSYLWVKWYKPQWLKLDKAVTGPKLALGQLNSLKIKDISNMWSDMPKRLQTDKRSIVTWGMRLIICM